MLFNIYINQIISLIEESIKEVIIPSIDFYDRRLYKRDKEVDQLYKELIDCVNQ